MKENTDVQESSTDSSRGWFLFNIGAYFVVSGIDYAVILPSINFYLIDIGASSRVSHLFYSKDETNACIP